MTENGRKRKRLSWRRFMRNESGSAFVEYGFIAAPFFLLMFGVAETLLTYTASLQLEAGLEAVARRVRTGEVQAAGLTAGEFKEMLCEKVSPLIPCDANLYVDVREFTQFSNVAHTSPLDEEGNINMNFQFSPGPAGAIVLARAFYVWHLNLPDVGLGLSNMAGSDRLLSSAQVFRNEP